jgi:nucleoside 2-deoxyribosyltransferase
MATKVSVPKNILRDTRCYLIGAMQYADGRGWRESVKEKLKNTGIKFYDPYFKPFVHDIPEDNASRAEMLHWMETEQYDLVAQRMKQVRGYDLRLCDVCDWFIAVIKPSVASWGSAEEITTVIRQKKPVFVVIDDPKKKAATPLWIMAMLPHKYIYGSLEDAVDTIIAINNGVVKMSSDRWKLLKPELR